MIRLLTIILLICLTISSCGTILYQSKEQKVVYNAKTFVKKIVSINGGHCSSVFINYKNKVRHVTNAHCCKLTMLYKDKEVKFLKIDEPVDLCELGHDDMSKTGINFSPNTPEVTNTIHTVGYPGHYELTIGQGRIVADLYNSPLNNQLLYRTSAFTIPGSSGGGAFDENGDLFGIVSQGNGLLHGAFIPAKTVKEFLD